MEAERQDPMDLATLRQKGLLSSSAASLDVDSKSDLSKDALPLSPPMTDVSTAASSDSSPANISPPHMPVGTPPLSPHRDSSDRRSPKSPGSPIPPFPAEVFSNILSFLPQRAVAPLCRVSRAWQQHILSDTRLWSTLATRLDLDEDDMCRAVCSRAGTHGGSKRASSGICTLRLVLGSDQTSNGRRMDRVSTDFVLERVHRVVEYAQQASVSSTASGPAGNVPRIRSTLRTLVVELSPNTTTSAHVLDFFGKTCRHPLFVELQEVRLRATLPDFDLSGAFLQMWPSVTSFEFRAEPGSFWARTINLSNWQWQGPPSRNAPPVTSLGHLASLSLSHVFVGDVDVPDLPALRHITLHNVRWEGLGLFHLLRRARRSIETILVNQISFEPAEDTLDDWLQHVDVANAALDDDDGGGGPARSSFSPWLDAVPILLPALRDLEIIGPSPPFFATLETLASSSLYDDEDPYPTPVLQMPSLERCKLEAVDVESEFEDDSLGPLAVLGQNAPRVSTLVLNELIVNDWAVHCCLSGMHAKVTTLDLFQSSVTDHLIVRLPALVPFLKVLDVRQCDDVTPQGVARMVEVIRMHHDEGQSRVERVFMDPPSHSGASYVAYQWLDFVDVLVRDEWDFEGMGPRDPADRQKWRRLGKRDIDWEHKEQLNQIEEVERADRERAREAAKLRAFQVAMAGGSSSSRVAPGPCMYASAAGPLPPLPASPFTYPTHAQQSRLPSTSVPPFRPHSFAPSQPSQLASVPMQQQRPIQPVPLHPPTVAPSSVWLRPSAAHYQRPSPADLGPACEQPHFYRAPAPRASPPLAPQSQYPLATETIAETDADYSFLDGADGGASQLSPAFVRAQMAELERMGAVHEQQAQAQAVAAAQRQVEVAAAGKDEQDRREQAQAAATLVVASLQCRAEGGRQVQEEVVSVVQASIPAVNGEMWEGLGFAHGGDDDDDNNDDDDDDDDDDDMVGGGDEAAVQQHAAPDEDFAPLV